MSPLERMITLFAKKEKRPRLLALAAKRSRWSDFRAAFLHDRRSLDPSTMTPLSTAEVEEIVVRLGAKSNARAHSVSELAEIDDRETSLADALRAAVGRERDTIVFCLETERAYYENHEGERFVLHR